MPYHPPTRLGIPRSLRIAVPPLRCANGGAGKHAAPFIVNMRTSHLLTHQGAMR